MPDPGVYVVREHGRLTISRAYRGALTLDRDLFWGPDRFLELANMQTAVEGPGVEVSGAAVVDLDARELAWFTFGALSHIPSRRRYLDLGGTVGASRSSTIGSRLSLRRLVTRWH